MKTTFSNDDDHENWEDEDQHQKAEAEATTYDEDDTEDGAKFRRSRFNLNELLAPGLQGSLNQLTVDSMRPYLDGIFKKHEDMMQDQISNLMDIGIGAPSLQDQLKQIADIPSTHTLMDQVLDATLKPSEWFAGISSAGQWAVDETVGYAPAARASDAIARAMPDLTGLEGIGDLSTQMADFMNHINSSAEVESLHETLKGYVQVPDSAIGLLGHSFDSIGIDSLYDAVRVAETDPEILKAAEAAVEERPEILEDLPAILTGETPVMWSELTMAERSLLVVTWAYSAWSFMQNAASPANTTGLLSELVFVILICYLSAEVLVHPVRGRREVED